MRMEFTLNIFAYFSVQHEVNFIRYLSEKVEKRVNVLAAASSAQRAQSEQNVKSFVPSFLVLLAGVRTVLKHPTTTLTYYSKHYCYSYYY